MLDISVMIKYLPLMGDAFMMTIYLSVISLVIGLVFGMGGALAKLSTNPVLRFSGNFYVWIIRSTPLLVQLFIIYFGLPQFGPDLTAFAAGALGLGINVGAYNAETIRSGIQAIGKGQTEAAESIGMTEFQCMRRIILPQALKIMIPTLGNNFIILIKDTSLVSTITVIEITMRSQMLIGTSYKAFEMYLLAAILYAVLTSTVAFALHRVEMKLNTAQRA